MPEMPQALASVIGREWPISTAELWHTLDVMRRNGCNMQGLPTTETDLAAELKRLESQGYLQGNAEGWAPARPERKPAGLLF